MREIRTLRATWRGLETWCGSGPPGPYRRASPRPYLGGRGGGIPPRYSTICEPMKLSPRHEIRSAGISTFTTEDDRIRALTTAPQIKPTSIFLRSARRPNPGRGSTYRCGNFVQTTGTSSMTAIARIFTRATPVILSDSEALKTVALLSGTGLFVFLLLASYGLDMSVGFF